LCFLSKRPQPFVAEVLFPKDHLCLPFPFFCPRRMVCLWTNLYHSPLLLRVFLAPFRLPPPPTDKCSNPPLTKPFYRALCSDGYTRWPFYFLPVCQRPPPSVCPFSSSFRSLVPTSTLLQPYQCTFFRGEQPFLFPREDPAPLPKTAASLSPLSVDQPLLHFPQTTTPANHRWPRTFFSFLPLWFSPWSQQYAPALPTAYMYLVCLLSQKQITSFPFLKLPAYDDF